MKASGARAPALAILAGGASERLGQCKALADLGPGNAIELLARAGRSFDALPILVVAGAHHREIAAAVASSRALARAPAIEVAHNADWRDGPISSVRTAHALRPDRDLCLAPVDVPLVSREVFDRLLARWMELAAPPSGWLAPRLHRARSERMASPRARERDSNEATERGTYGHPIVVGRALLARLAELAPGATLRDLRRHAAPLSSTEVSDPAILDDLDTPEDLARIRARACR